MHQYKTVAQALLVLSILNPVFAAPIIPAPAGTQSGGTTTYLLPPAESDGPPYDSMRRPFQVLAPSSGLSQTTATDGQVAGAHPAGGPAPVSDSATDRPDGDRRFYGLSMPTMKNVSKVTGYLAATAVAALGITKFLEWWMNRERDGE
jgi:hypothetical protein